MLDLAPMESEVWTGTENLKATMVETDPHTSATRSHPSQAKTVGEMGRSMAVDLEAETKATKATTAPAATPANLSVEA